MLKKVILLVVCCCSVAAAAQKTRRLERREVTAQVLEESRSLHAKLMRIRVALEGFEIADAVHDARSNSTVENVLFKGEALHGLGPSVVFLQKEGRRPVLQGQGSVPLPSGQYKYDSMDNVSVMLADKKGRRTTVAQKDVCRNMSTRDVYMLSYHWLWGGLGILGPETYSDPVAIHKNEKGKIVLPRSILYFPEKSADGRDVIAGYQGVYSDRVDPEGTRKEFALLRKECSIELDADGLPVRGMVEIPDDAFFWAYATFEVKQTSVVDGTWLPVEWEVEFHDQPGASDNVERVSHKVDLSKTKRKTKELRVDLSKAKVVEDWTTTAPAASQAAR